MVRAAIVVLFLLSGCDRQRDAEQRSTYADVGTATALAQLEAQREKIERLEDIVEKQGRYIAAVHASLDEARENHTALHKTYNEGVDRSNKRAQINEANIDWLLRRNGVARQ
jgi:hypothetical protein